MPQPETTATWVVVVIVLAIVIVLLALIAARRRGRQDFEVRPLPADRVTQYQERLDELERTFVTRPRQAVAEARQVVDEMLAQKGYPARLGADGRARDIAATNRGHANRYRAAAEVNDRSTTEEMRQAMEHFLAVGRELLSEAPRVETSQPSGQRRPTPAPGAEQAGQPAAERQPESVHRPAAERDETVGDDGERRFAG